MTTTTTLSSVRSLLSYMVRGRHRRLAKRPSRRDFPAYGIELLEDRALLAASWIPQGPGPIHDGQTEGIPNNPVSGAVQTVVAHPTNANILWIGATNGGLWKTTNATSPSPTWTPVADLAPSLSIGALSLDPTDPTHNTLIAGIGRYSSLARDGGSRAGLLRSTDGGNTWTTIDGGGTLLGKNISGIAARGSTIVVSVNVADNFSYPNIGIFRSTNGGASFAQISISDGSFTGLPAGVAYDLVGDPGNPSVLYTSIALPSTAGAQGIYKSTNGGANWSRVSNATINGLIGNVTSNIEMSVGTNNNVYAGIINQGQLAGLFRSGDGGANWTQLDTPQTNEGGNLIGINPRPKGGGPGDPPEAIAGGQGSIHFSILADPVNHNIVYVGGDRQPLEYQFPTSTGARNYSGRLFRVDASLASGSQAISLTHNPSTNSNSSPHADSRDMTFNPNGEIVEVDDGGIYLRTNPRGVGDWFGLHGNLQNTEFHSVAYDTLTNVIFGGTQDVGTPQQRTSGTIWDTVTQGDGGVVAVDTVSRAGLNQSIRYSSYQFFGDFRYQIYDANNNLISSARPALSVGGQALTRTLDPTIQFYQPIELNKVDPSLGVIGTNKLYEGSNFFASLTDLAVGTNASIRAMAYGGYSGGVPNPDVLYYGSSAGVRVRTASGGTFANTTYAGQTPVDMVLDPDEWNTVIVIDSNQVFLSTNAGADWTDITGNLGATGIGRFRTVEYVEGPFGDGIVVGGNTGVFVSLVTELGTWSDVGPNLPNAPVMDLRWDATDDVLLAGTLGRGAWLLPNASDQLSPNDPPVIAVPGTQPAVEDVALAISGISIADTDAGAGELEVTLGAGNGRLTLASIAGLTFSSGDGTADRDMTFTGTLADLNAALATLTYLGNLNFNGNDQIEIGVDDLGNLGSGGPQTDFATIDVTVAAVNDPPVITSAANAPATEDADSIISGISISDVDAGAGALEVTLSVSNGTLTLGSLTGLSFSVGDGTADAGMTFTGTRASINTALAALVYRGNLHFNGSETLNIGLDDQGNTGSGGALSDAAIVSIAVGAVNDAPSWAVPGDQSVAIATDLVLNGIVITDVDAGAGELLVTLEAPNGTLTLSQTNGLTFQDGTADGESRLVFTGTLSDVNLALSGLTYRGNAGFNDRETVTLEVDDQGNTGAGTNLTAAAEIIIDVGPANQAPSINVPGPLQVNEDTVLAVTGVSVSDPDAGSGLLWMSLSAGNGTLTLGTTTGLVFQDGTANGEATLTFTGTLANINAALAGLTYLGDANYYGPDAIELDVDDQGSTGSGTSQSASASIALTIDSVNDAPTLDNNDGLALTGVEEDAVDGDIPGDLVSEILASDGGGRIFDVEGDPEGIAVVGVNDTNGQWQFSINGGSNWTAFGSVSNTSAVLLAANAGTRIRFVPNAAFNGVAGVVTFRAWDGTDGNPNGSTGINVSVNGGSTAYSSSAATAEVKVNEVNDAPEITVPGAQTVDEFTDLLISGIVVSDIDSGAGQLEITLSAEHGVLTLATTAGLTFSEGTGTADSLMVFTGTEAAVNAALAGLTYRGDFGYEGSDTITIGVDDLGNTGIGGNQTAGATISVTLQHVNDVPVVTLSAGAVTFTEGDRPVRLDSLATVEDADSPNFNGGSLTIGISANAETADMLEIRHAGTGSGQIGLLGSTVLYEGVAIGTFSGGRDGATPLVVLLNGNATLPAVQALLRSITFQSQGDPVQSVRTVEVVLTDGDGGTSAAATRDVSVITLVEISIVGDRLYAFGTAGDDEFHFVPGSTEHSLWINGRRFRFDPLQIRVVEIHGLGGYDVAILNGSAGDDIANILVGQVELEGVNYSIDGRELESIRVRGNGGNDLTRLRDSAGDDLFRATQDRSFMIGAGFFNWAQGFGKVYGFGTGGEDRAELYGSAGNDQFIARPERSYIAGNSFHYSAAGFDRVVAWSGGGADRATMYDSAGDDRFFAYAHRAYLTGPGYYNSAEGFSKVVAKASAGDDRAILYDSAGNDRFYAYPERSYLAGNGFSNTAEGFDRVYGRSTGGGIDDRAYFFDSTGADRFYARPDRSYMYGDDFYNSAQGFDRAYADSSLGGADQAYLFDSMGDDTFYGRNDYGYMTGSTYYNRARGFGLVKAYSYDPGFDRLNVDSLEYVFRAFGDWFR